MIISRAGGNVVILESFLDVVQTLNENEALLWYMTPRINHHGEKFYIDKNIGKRLDKK